LKRIDTSRLQVLILPHLLILSIYFGLVFKIQVRIKDNINPLQMSCISFVLAFKIQVRIKDNINPLQMSYISFGLAFQNLCEDQR
jgi:hypothetical protein